jgi:hypothetical protein
MVNAAVFGSNASATRAGSVSAAAPVRLSGSIDGVGVALLVAVLLIGLILISAGCGPPN